MTVNKIIILTFIFTVIGVNGIITSNFVEILNGTLQGYENMDYYGFQNIPYAEPPIGINRFASPKFYNKKFDGVYNATKYEIVCAQLNPGEYFQDYKLMGTEDCLYLNIFVPKVDNSDIVLPVMVFLDSGAFTYGSSTYLKPRTLMRSKSFILVTLNFRLGPFGFLSTGDDVISGNMGLKDQKLALQWVKENIESFGGDPNRILLAGFSAGAVSVDFLSMSSGIENLISAAVAFSGSSLNPWALKIKPFKLAKNLAKIVRCPITNTSEKIKDCLTSQSVESIIKGFENLINANANGVQAFGPVIEANTVQDAIITQHPRLKLQEKIPKIPYLSSMTAQDGAVVSLDLFRLQENGTTALDQFKNKPIKYLHWILFNDGFKATITSRKHASYILKSYNLTTPIRESDFDNLNKLFTDVLFKDGIKESLKLRQLNSNISVYSYIYDNPPLLNVANLISKRMDLNFGTTHGDDVFLFLNSPLRNLIAFKTDEIEISGKFIEMVRKFVNTGKPKFDGLEFPESTPDKIRALRIKANSVDVNDL